MAKVTVLADKEIKKMYPSGSSYSAYIAHEAISSGFKLAYVEDDDFIESWEVILEVCMKAIEGSSCFNKMKCVVEPLLSENKVIIAFDDKCNT